MPRCPTCHGTRTVSQFVETPGGGILTRTAPCQECHGEGFVSNEQANRIKRGWKLREERIMRGETMKQSAERHCIPVKKWAQMEAGREEVPDGFLGK